MSDLHALLFFGGIPLLVIIAVWVLLSARAAATRSHHPPGKSWQAEPEWFSGREVDPTQARQQIESAGHAAPGRAGEPSAGQTGGASATW